MPDQSLYDILKDQLFALQRAFLGPKGLREFLEAEAIPERVTRLLPDARAVAEMLLASPTEHLVAEELRADEERTRSFFLVAITQLPVWRERFGEVHAMKEGPPFSELAKVILALTDPKP